MSTNAWEWEEGFAEGRKAGLEEAAKVADIIAQNCHNHENDYGSSAAEDIAQAIRNLANQAKDEKGEG